jgi:cyclic pyranopterin monophosphate synthase
VRLRKVRLPSSVAGGRQPETGDDSSVLHGFGAPHVGREWRAAGPSAGVAGTMACMSQPLSHLGPDGRARMVDVGAKAATARRAVAAARVIMSPATRTLALSGQGPKGPVLETARLAGIQAAKRTSELIPLCHPLPLDLVELDIAPEGDSALCITATAHATWRTGVEMEALTAAAVAALTLIDMLKAAEKTLVITDLRLLEKSGGRSGEWKRPG